MLPVFLYMCFFCFVISGKIFFIWTSCSMTWNTMNSYNNRRMTYLVCLVNITWTDTTVYMYDKGLFRVKMHSPLLRPSSDNIISLWCKLRHTIDLYNYRSWFPFWDNCFVWLKFLFFIFLKPAHNLFVNGIIPSLLLPYQGMYCTQVNVHVCIF